MIEDEAGSIYNNFKFYFDICLKADKPEDCNDSTKISEIAESLVVYITKREKTVDLNDIKNPIKTATSELGMTNLNLKAAKSLFLNLVENEVTLEDTIWFNFVEEEPVKFLNFDTVGFKNIDEAS